MMDDRVYWYAPDLGMKDEPLVKSLVEYRLYEDRQPVRMACDNDPRPINLVSSRTWDGRQMPILDLDFDHLVVESTSEGHHHLFINVPMSQLKWAVLMLVLWWAGVLEMGNVVWSLRRGANFVRVPGLTKSEEEAAKPSYGWFKKL